MQFSAPMHVHDPQWVGDARALVVEDDPLERMLLRATLERGGFAVTEAADGDEAVEVFQAVRPHVVMLDILMPGIDGFETCRRIRELPAGARTPVMVTTALEDESSIAKAYAAGATDFITKPVNYALLIHRVRYTLRAHRVLATLDALTGLPGRDVLREHLECQREFPVAVLYMDLDRFRRINDTLGRGPGDELMLMVAQRLLACLRRGATYCVGPENGNPGASHRSGDTMLARAGSDEFIISIRGMAAPSQVDRVAARVLDAVSAPFEVGGETLHITASIGIAMTDAGSDAAGALIERAESAKDQVKNSGRNGRGFYDDALTAQARRVFTLEKVLRRALEHEHFAMHFQPKLDLQSGRPIGMEALMRLDQPGHGPISPAEFIPVAEQTGLIQELDRWALRESCAQAQRCVSAGLVDLGVAVNVSALLFKHHNLSRYLAEILSDTGLDPARLEVELTERLLLQDTRASLEALSALREIGVSVSMDDFGTGYSSLSYLKRFKVNGLKIDRSFIRDVTSNSDDAAIVDAIIGLGRSLGLQVTAEGVETAQQAAFLRARGCPQAQGFLYAPALPVDEFIRWMAAFQPLPAGREVA